MRVFSYVIEHDLGFAPNPYHGFCTLACCKPLIRKAAQVGDLILGFGAAKPRLAGKLCYWMRVDEVLTFDEYWLDPRFRRKRPNMSGTTYLRYGDNLYHRNGGEGPYLQEDSFHSFPNGVLCKPNRKRDTGRTDRVLVSGHFTYWGKNGIAVPDFLNRFVKRGMGHNYKSFTDAEIQALGRWLNSMERGIQGEPAHWQFLNRRRRRPARPTRASPERHA